MTDLDQTEPFAWFQHWMAEAETSEPSDPNAMTVVTVGPGGGLPRPAARVRVSRFAGPLRVLAEHAVQASRPDDIRAGTGWRMENWQAVPLMRSGGRRPVADRLA